MQSSLEPACHWIHSRICFQRSSSIKNEFQSRGIRFKTGKFNLGNHECFAFKKGSAVWKPPFVDIQRKHIFHSYVCSISFEQFDQWTLHSVCLCVCACMFAIVFTNWWIFLLLVVQIPIIKSILTYHFWMSYKSYWECNAEHTSIH